MASVTRSDAAENDIKEVLAYTNEHWDVVQALEYADLIEEAIVAIAADPFVGRPRFGVRPGILAHHIGQRGRNASHFLYYRIDLNGDVEIVRFLHERMDPGLHL
jgi:toxin ParE1/3/4